MATRHAPRTPVINLLRGWPNRALLPVADLSNAANAVLTGPRTASAALEYAPDAGHEPCRKAIAGWLTSFYRPSNPVAPQRICITGGASQNLGCMLNVYTDPAYTRHVWIVAPAYFLAFRIFEDAGFGKKLRPIPEDEHGIDVSSLRREMAASEELAKQHGNTAPVYKSATSDRAKVYKHIIYCVPTFSNPSSQSMTVDRRRELVRLAREYDALIAPDDVYDMLQWPAYPDRAVDRSMQSATLPRLVDVDRELDGGAERPSADGFGNACSNGTFSKIIGPGIRTGWVEGTAKFAHGVSQYGSNRSGGSPSSLSSMYITHLLQSGRLQEHIHAVLRPAYAARYRILVDAISKYLVPLGFAMVKPNHDIVGGYFVWLSLPTGIDASHLAKKCVDEENVIIAHGTLFAVPGQDVLTFESNIRLCFSYVEEQELVEAVARIGRVAASMLENAVRS